MPVPGEKIWTYAAFELLFEQVVDRFGPYSEWVRPNSPGHIEDDVTEKEFRKFLDNFATVVGANSGDAVGMILMLAVREKLNPSPDLLAAAIKTRFITLMPSLLWGMDESLTP